MGWAPHTVEPTPCEGVVYICCTLMYNYHYSFQKGQQDMNVTGLFIERDSNEFIYINEFRERIMNSHILMK
jgi:hypothetical protein